jgi:hypothetical protein
VSLSEPVELVRRLGDAPRIGAIVLAEKAIDAYLAGYCHPDDRAIALDILLRDLARLRVQEVALDRLIGEVEAHIDLLHRDLARRAA